jgi:hypothetical protein
MCAGIEHKLPYLSLTETPHDSWVAEIHAACGVGSRFEGVLVSARRLLPVLCLTLSLGAVSAAGATQGDVVDGSGTSIMIGRRLRSPRLETRAR